MAYFLILPAFFLWLFVAAAGVLATRLHSRFAPAYPYALHISLWATLGFVVANAVLLGLLALGLVVLDQAEASPSLARDTAQIAWGLTAVGGPFVASALGWLAGFAFGALFALLRSRRLPPSNSFKPKPLRDSA